MSKKISSIVLAVCLLVLFVAKYVQPTTAYNRSLLEVNVTGYNLVAGDENELDISIENMGWEVAYDIKASLTVPSSVSGISIVSDSWAGFKEIRYQEVEWMHPILYVASDCPLGAYSLTLQLDYYDSDDGKYVEDLQIGVVVDAVKPTEVNLVVDVSNYYVAAGAENEINIAVANVGKKSVYDIEATLTSGSPNIVILKEPSNLFDVIEVNSSVCFEPLLGISRITPLGAYSLTLTLNYKDSEGVSHVDSSTVGVLVDSVKPTERTRIAVQSFQVTPTDIFPGDELILEMELKNRGANAYDVQVQLNVNTQSPLVALNPTLVFVGDLRTNQTAGVAYDLRVSGDADASLYDLQLVISYYDVDDQSNSLTEAISIEVQSIIDFRLLDVQPSNITAEPGETVTIEADLLLLGTETVDFVEVEIVENRSIGPFISVPKSYEYIGRVDPDSPVLFTVQFTVDPNATSGSYALQTRVSCWDGYNQKREDTIELPVIINEFSNQSQGTSPTLWDVFWTLIRMLFGLNP